MRDILQSYAGKFASQLETISLSENEQRSVNHPVVFLFIGDLVKDALSALIQMNEEKWHNSSGVVYFHTYQTDTITAENVLSIQLPDHINDRRRLRKDLYEAFYRDEEKLIELNKAYRRLTTRIAEYGKVYSSLKRVNLCVVTAIDDPANVLIQEFTLLLESILQESFKSVEVDLYGLLTEKQEDQNFAMSTANGISFLHELDAYQNDKYTFTGELQLTEDHLRLTVSHPPSPLYDLVYLLSDKDENGLLSSDAALRNIEMISNLILLKNRKLISDYHEKMDSYNHQDFLRAIRGNSVEPVYASAGFAKVSRPNKAIALHAASHFFAEYLAALKEAPGLSAPDKVLSLFELSESSFQKHYHNCLPSPDILEDMTGLMGAAESYHSIKRMSVKEAEEYMFASGARQFFFTNAEEPVQEYIRGLNLKKQIERCLYKNIIGHEKYGFFCGFLWTRESSDSEGPSVLEEINKMLRNVKQERLAAEAKLEQFYEQLVDHCDFKKSFLPFSDRRNLHLYLRYFFEMVYGAKVDILKLKVKQAVLVQYREVLEEHHRLLREKIALMEQVESCLKQGAAESLAEADDALDQNIAEYYGGVITGITPKLKEKYGPHFFQEDRFFGNLYDLLEKNGPRGLLERLLEVCNREVLTQEEFHRSFEDELLERANVQTRYDNQKVLSKEDLFKQLYHLLEENSAIHIEVFNYTQVHRHEERYFFGDFYSQFMGYALGKEQDARPYKAGCAHEKKSSGIEKLALMGGFRVKDLMYYRNGEKYYRAYIKNGYEFHVTEIQAEAL